MARFISHITPWTPGFNKQELRDKITGSYSRTTKKALKNAGMKYSMSRGYYYDEDDSWGPQPEKPLERTVKLANGKTVKVYDNDYGPGISFNGIAADNDLADYIDTANFKYAIDGCGHIARLEYAPYRTMMRVTFQPETVNGKTWGRDDIAVYFKVPTSVFGELYWLAESKVTQASPVTGEIRHALGIRFWDLVRIRGQLTGGRYPYTVTHLKEYAKKVKPVSEYKIKQDMATAKLFGEEEAADLNASREAFKQAVRQTSTAAKNSTDKDEAIAALFGSARNASSTLDGYARNFATQSEKATYAALTTLTDKYNYLLSKGRIEDYLNE